MTILNTNEFKLARFYSVDLASRLPEDNVFTIENVRVEEMPRKNGKVEPVLVLDFAEGGPALCASKTTQRALRTLFSGIEKKDLVGKQVRIGSGMMADITGTQRNMLFVEGIDA